MIEEFAELINKFPETSSVKEVTNRLRGKTEFRIYEILTPFLDKYEGRIRVSIVELLVKKINKKQLLLSILQLGLSKKMPNEIGYWLKFLLPKIGAKKFVDCLYALEDEDAKDIATYHITFFEPAMRDQVNKEIVAIEIARAQDKGQ